jgi:hypothetical protein
MNTLSSNYIVRAYSMAHRDTEQLAYTLWEQQGRPDGLHTEHWLEAERRLATEPGAGRTDNKKPDHDAPGKATPASSRQQVVPNQEVQTGSPELDRELSEKS